MNWFSLSLLLVAACVLVTIPPTCASSVSSVNQDDMTKIITKMITTHLTRASHSFHTLQTSTPTSSMFGPVNGASQACKASSVVLETNNAILAANASVIASGCIIPAKQQTCNLSSPPYGCKCITTFSNDANLRSLVTQSNGRVCSINMLLIATYSNGISADFDYQGIGGLHLVGSECNNNDNQAMLSYLMDVMAEGFRDSTSSNPVRSITGTFTFCGTSYTGTRNHAYNKQPIAIIIASLIGIIITIINVAL